MLFGISIKVIKNIFIVKNRLFRYILIGIFGIFFCKKVVKFNVNNVCVLLNRVFIILKLKNKLKKIMLFKIFYINLWLKMIRWFKFFEILNWIILEEIGWINKERIIYKFIMILLVKIVFSFWLVWNEFCIFFFFFFEFFYKGWLMNFGYNCNSLYFNMES